MSDYNADREVCARGSCRSSLVGRPSLVHKHSLWRYCISCARKIMRSQDQRGVSRGSAVSDDRKGGAAMNRYASSGLPSLLAHDRICPLCDGYGVLVETIVEYLRSRRCTCCDGTGKIARPYGWRPYEPCKGEG